MAIRRAPPLLCVLTCSLFSLLSYVTAYQNTFFGAQRPFTGKPVADVKSVKLSCLSTRFPADSGYDTSYTARCPDTANITEWFDREGVLHRRVEHAPLKGVTWAMVRWFLSPGTALLNPVVEFNGKSVYWYKLWHPVDHEHLIPFVAPQPDLPFIPWLWVNVKETYRPAPPVEKRGYAVDACVYVADARLGIQFRAPGGVVVMSLLNLPWYDSPEGLRFTSEFIVGVSAPGIGRVVNQLATQPILTNQFPGLLDGVTRHHVEEVGNWQVFLPDIWARYSHLGRASGAALHNTTTVGVSSGDLARWGLGG